MFCYMYTCMLCQQIFFLQQNKAAIQYYKFIAEVLLEAHIVKSDYSGASRYHNHHQD